MTLTLADPLAFNTILIAAITAPGAALLFLISWKCFLPLFRAPTRPGVAIWASSPCSTGLRQHFLVHLACA